MANERKTPSGLDVQPVYRADGQTAHPVRDIGEPGQYPYTRGIHPGMYRERPWTIATGRGAMETNERFYYYLLRRGRTGRSTAFDMPGLMGCDSDDAKRLGEGSEKAWPSSHCGTWSACPRQPARRTLQFHGQLRPQDSSPRKSAGARGARRGFRTERDRSAADLALEGVHQPAGSRSGMMPPMLDASGAHATEAGFVRAVRAVFGSNREAAVV